MANTSTPPCTLLTSQLLAASIPIDGVSDSGNGVFTIQYGSTATVANRTAGAAILAAFNGKGRVARPISAIMTDVKALNGPQQNLLLLAMAAAFLQQNPSIATLAGVSIAGDQSDV